MMLDQSFVREICRVANGDGSHEHRRAFIKKLKEVKNELSVPQIRERYSECIKKHGRVPVAICTALTIMDRKDRLEKSSCIWAYHVLKHWTNRFADTSYAVIQDGLHPTRIEEYAGSFLRMTISE